MDAAARVYQHRANVAVQGWVPEFGVDDQPATSAGKADAVVAAALMATMSALRDTARDLREQRPANEQRGPLALSWSWADESDEDNLETVITIHLAGPATSGSALLHAIFNANREGEAPRDMMVMLDRLTSQ